MRASNKATYLDPVGIDVEVGMDVDRDRGRGKESQKNDNRAFTVQERRGEARKARSCRMYVSLHPPSQGSLRL